MATPYLPHVSDVLLHFGICSRANLGPQTFLGPRTPPFVSSETRLSLAFIVSDADATRSVVTAVGRNEGVVGRGQSSVIANVIGVILRQQ